MKTLIFTKEKNKRRITGCMINLCDSIQSDLTEKLATFTFKAFSLNHRWENEFINSMFWEKLEVFSESYTKNGITYITNNTFEVYDDIDRIAWCFFGTDALIYHCDDHSLSIALLDTNDVDEIITSKLIVSLDDGYDYTVENGSDLSHFGYDTAVFENIRSCTNRSSLISFLSGVFGLPFLDEDIDEFLQTAKRKDQYGIGGRFDERRDRKRKGSCLPELSFDEQFGFLDKISSSMLTYVPGEGFKIDNSVIDLASFHILSGDYEKTRKLFTDLTANPIAPDIQKMSSSEKTLFEFSMSVLGSDFLKQLKKGSADLRILQKRKIYAIQSNNICSVYSDAFSYDKLDGIHGEAETYFFEDRNTYILCFGIDADEGLYLQLIHTGQIISEIRINAPGSAENDKWFNTQALSDIMIIDVQNLKECVNKSDLIETAESFSKITCLPLNLSFKQIAKSPKKYNAEKWQ